MDQYKNEKKLSLGAPLSGRGWPTWLVYLLSVLGFAYLIFPTFGIFELIPDYIPIIGHIDEGTATVAIWYGLLEYLEKRKRKHSQE